LARIDTSNDDPVSLAPPRRPEGGWELPEQLRYLERLTPRTPPEPMAIAPRSGWR